MIEKMDKIYVYLDDIRTPTSDNWVVVRNYDEFVGVIDKHGLDNIEVISLDHDLGETAMIEYYNNVKKNYALEYSNIEEKTGYDACKYLVSKSMETGIPLPQIYVHSANPIGSGNMMGYINNYFMNCRTPQTCIRISVPHTIDESLHLSPEARKAKWDRTKTEE